MPRERERSKVSKSAAPSSGAIGPHLHNNKGPHSKNSQDPRRAWRAESPDRARTGKKERGRKRGNDGEREREEKKDRGKRRIKRVGGSEKRRIKTRVKRAEEDGEKVI